MPNSPQDVYARNLLSHHGYPLRTPEPHIELPDSYRQEGLKIGDVGVVVPEEGSFDVFFNIALPRDHPLHRVDGVPNNFTQVRLRREDYRIVPDAESPGRVFSSSTVECVVSCVDPFYVDGTARGLRLTDHHLSLRQNEGAVLILPQGAERHRLSKELLHLDVILHNALEWYRFAREKLYRDISDDALYLITGFHKAPSWSLASYQSIGGSSARCKIVQLGKGGAMFSDDSTWETPHPLEWRIGPRHSVGIPNQSVFIIGFKIAVNRKLLYLKKVTVKVDHSKRTLATTFVGFGASLANRLSRITSNVTRSPAEPAACDKEASEPKLEGDSPGDGQEGVEVGLVPQVSQPFHPSDIINRYMLRKVPSAEIAVTHDSQWITLLEKGVLNLQDMLQEGRLEAVVSQEYNIITRDGAVYLQSINPDEALNMGTTTTLFAESTPVQPHEEGPLGPFKTTDGGDVDDEPPDHWSPVVEPPTPRSAPASLKTPHINASQLGAHGRPQPVSKETLSSMGSSASIFRPSSDSNCTSYSEVYLESCAEGNGDFPTDLPFRVSTSTVRRRRNWPSHNGAFGDMWECDLISGGSSRIVAVKAVRINANGNGSEDLKAHERKLRRELKVLGILRHRNIVPLLGVVSGFGPLPSTVSPWFCRGSLLCYLAHHQASKSEKHRLLGDVAVGLCYLHSQDVIHGDLHSGNVLIDDDGTACITDFGLSFMSDFVGTSYLKSGICGGVHFADPALVKRAYSSQKVIFYPTKPCDIYSFGGLMLHVLSGKKPYDGIRSSTHLFAKVLKGERPQIPTHDEDITDWHKSLIRLCWAREERERPSAADLVWRFDRQSR